MQEKRLKALFDNIPTLDELRGEGFRADIILVDAEKDRKLCMLKQLIVALVKGLNSNPAVMIKKIAGLVRTLIVSCSSCLLCMGFLIYYYCLLLSSDKIFFLV